MNNFLFIFICCLDQLNILAILELHIIGNYRYNSVFIRTVNKIYISYRNKTILKYIVIKFID